MQFKTAVLAAFVSSAAAMTVDEVNLVSVVVRSSITISEAPAVFRRDSSDDAKCESAAKSFATKFPLTDIPTPPPKLASDLASYYMSHTSVDSCKAPSFTGSLESEFASYTSEVLSFYDKYKPEIMTLYSACESNSVVQSEISKIGGDVGACGSTLDGGAAKTGGSGGSGSSSATTTAGTGSSNTATGSAAAATTSGSAADALAAGSFSGLAAIAGFIAYLL